MDPRFGDLTNRTGLSIDSMLASDLFLSSWSVDVCTDFVLLHDKVGEFLEIWKAC